MDELFCESCGKNMVSKDGKTMIGLRYSLEIAEDAPKDELKFVELQWGKYFNPNGVTIQLCMECFVDSAFSNHNPYL